MVHEIELMEAVRAVDESGLTEHQYLAVTKLLGMFMNEHSKAVKVVQVINAQSEIMFLKPVKH